MAGNTTRPPGSPARASFAVVRPARSTPGGERAARRALLGQLASLERELVEQRCSSWPRAMAETRAPRRVRLRGVGGSHLLSLGELERRRDELFATLSAERKALAQRTLGEEGLRRLREELILDPGAHPGARVSNREVGECGCGAVRSEPAGGLLGMLMGWWRVIVSSGCP